jgi:hypothetical protein
MLYLGGLNFLSNYAPIAIFAYNRPEHLWKTLDSLAQNFGAKESRVRVFVDGPKSLADVLLCKKSAEQVESFVKCFKEVSVKIAPKNLGLAKSVISGINEILLNNSKIIVIEDDLEISPYFLSYVNEGLIRYESDHSVGSIHGYVIPFEPVMDSSFFLRGGDCWGWGTWRNRWELFETDGASLLAQIEQNNLSENFDLQGSYPFTQMLRDQISGLNDSWAIRWHASLFLENRLTLYPAKSLINNSGFDGTGTHTGISNVFLQRVSNEMPNFPSELVENMEALARIQKWYSDVGFSGAKVKTINFTRRYPCLTPLILKTTQFLRRHERF